MELKSWFYYLITHSVFNFRLLIDGLNEVPNNRDNLLDTIGLIAESFNKVKICCSSRRERLFEQILQHNPSLRLEDLNYEDIQKHCYRRLHTTRARRYAYLVTEELRNAVNNGDDEVVLKRRLGECPGEMHKLFTSLVERQDKFYAKDPKPYLRLIEVATKRGDNNNHGAGAFLTFFELLVASSAQEEFISRVPKSLDASLLASLDSQAPDLKANVVVRCANLAELVPNRSDLQSYPKEFAYKELVNADSLEVRFIHRRVQDFLTDSEEGAALLRSYNMTEQNAVIRLTIASVTRFLATPYMSRVGKSLKWESLIEAGFWAKNGTGALDIIFPTLQARKPLRMPPFTAEDTSINGKTPPFNVLCPQLSPLENVAFGFATGFAMVAYTEAKLRALDLQKWRLVVGFSSCLCVRAYGLGRESSGFLTMFEPYLSLTSLTQNLTLSYILEPFTDVDFWVFRHLSCVATPRPGFHQSRF
ncbi:uncharacterized protein Z519_00251 [Cladophialophora bantiana CBS 173.52]|uniref:NACHT domain-containing protein n=1 Tax=Cladophialophora bantiana (strain ATCC 10958 / CBS 173.52 / CDC B-1940 / NIH 8579) TaxID=1442370 RepID=A0A0D2I5R6_CLAB1|nr:uncharacterized protein Z519_00251 [Cladophialophora bantiana CBS 173.52]KIW98590.1 hypothetical protein Z519_00251 [Cladophialophora bantiana CBS 173.52]